MRLAMSSVPFAQGATAQLHPASLAVRARAGGAPGATPLETAVVSAEGMVVFTGLEPDTAYWIAGQDAGGAWRWVQAHTPSSQTAHFEVDDPEDIALLIDCPAEQAAAALLIRKGGTELVSIDAEGILHISGAVAGLEPLVLRRDAPIDPTKAPYNCVPDAVIEDLASATDCYAGLQQALADGAAQGRPVVLPAGPVVGVDGSGAEIHAGYKCSAGLLAHGTDVRIEGAGRAGRLMFTTGQVQEFTWLTIKGPAESAGVGGYARNLELEAYTVHARGATPATAKIGVALHERLLFDLDGVAVNGAAVGFELEENCYGTIFRRCSTSSFMGQVGVNLNGGAGNDVKFYDCWFAGDFAAVCISANSSGFGFYGGQLVAGHDNAAPSDDAAIVVGLDYRTGATPGGDVTNCTFDGIDFEDIPYAWVIRSYCNLALTISNSLVLSHADHPMVGIWKDSAPGVGGSIQWSNNTVRGTFSNDRPWEFDPGTFSNTVETGTINAGIYDGSAPAEEDSRSMMFHSRHEHGTAFLGGGEILLNGVLLSYRGDLGQVQVSTDWAATRHKLVRALAGSAVWDPGSVADGDVTSTTLAVTGARAGQPCSVAFETVVPAGAILAGTVTANDVVTVTLFNKTGGALDLVSGTLHAEVSA
jgi:hypothetical protein